MGEEWQSVLADYQARIEKTRAMGSPERLEQQAAEGRLNVRARIETLVDPGSFMELGTLVGNLGDHGKDTPADGIVGGLAQINGQPVVVAAEDFSVMGGSIGFGNHAKRVRYAKIALQEHLPLVLMLEGAGERATNLLGRHPYAPNDLQLLARLKGVVPTVAIVHGASAGHSALSGVLMDYIVMVEGSSLFSAGPPLVEKALGEVVDKESLGGASVHCAMSGVAHDRVATEAEAFDRTRGYLSYFHADKGTDESATDNERILEIVPRNADQPYDMRAVVGEIADKDSFLEIQPEFGRSMIVGLARLGGIACAIVANQPLVLAGAIDHKAAQKAARFLRSTNAFELPVIFLADNPGVLPGTAAEADGTLLAAADMYMAQSELRGPKLHVTVRKAFGFGSSVMAMNPFDEQTLTLAFPGATLGGIPASGGASAATLDESKAAAVMNAEAEATLRSADTMAYDEIIDPRSLRRYLVTGLRASRLRRDAARSA